MEQDKTTTRSYCCNCVCERTFAYDPERKWWYCKTCDSRLVTADKLVAVYAPPA